MFTQGVPRVIALYVPAMCGHAAPLKMPQLADSPAKKRTIQNQSSSLLLSDKHLLFELVATLGPKAVTGNDHHFRMME